MFVGPFVIPGRFHVSLMPKSDDLVIVECTEPGCDYRVSGINVQSCAHAADDHKRWHQIKPLQTCE